jgi:glutamate-1-semialdehyde 2,1-aminomutase
MKTRDYSHLMDELEEQYTQRFARSAASNEEAKAVLVDGGSHTLRLFQPFPLRIVAAQGAWVRDEDDHRILDFWQGHLMNILGYNPEVVSAAVAGVLGKGFGLQAGFADRLQTEAAAILCRQTGAERVRFTTSGSLATMYAVLLSRAFSGRDLVMKVGGGWHGGQPWGLKGVGYKDEGNLAFQGVDTEGLPAAVTDSIVVTGFNDPQRLRDHFREFGDRLACFIVEPFIGAGGLIPANPEYLELARELTQQYGSVLIFDEVITGFRFRAGNIGALYGIQPDLAVFGKIIGGGMPVAAVAGRADIMGLAGRERGCKVAFSGGTYSAHSASMVAAKTIMNHLVENEGEIYPRLAALGEKARRTLEAAFADEGLYARCTGYGNGVVPGSAFAFIHFPYEAHSGLETPEDLFDPAICDVRLRQDILQLAFLLEDVFLVHGHGVVSTTHTDADMDVLDRASRRVARRVKKYL